MTHTVDAKVGARRGYHEVLGELLAYSQETAGNPNEEDRWAYISEKLKKPHYYELYSKEVESFGSPRISKEQWDGLMDQMLAKMRDVIREKGEIEAERQVARSNNLFELMPELGG